MDGARIQVDASDVFPRIIRTEIHAVIVRIPKPAAVSPVSDAPQVSRQGFNTVDADEGHVHRGVAVGRTRQQVPEFRHLRRPHDKLIKRGRSGVSGVIDLEEGIHDLA